RGERAGSFILLIILLVVLAIRALNSGSTSSGRGEGYAGLSPSDSAAVIPGDAGGQAGGFVGSDSAVSGLSGAVSLGSGLNTTGSTPAAAGTETPGKSKPLYTFDPNTASEDKLLGLGLSERQVRTIINYRSTGARFDEPEDFRKIYGIDREMQDRLIPYIIIAGPSKPEGPGRSVTGNEQFAEAGEEHSGGTVERLDINHADSSDFEKLAGIGPVLAARIVKYRNLLGYFSCPSQLSEVYGLNTEVIAMHYPAFTCDSSLIRKIDINKASYADLLRHPYINRAQLEGILSYRRLSGPLTGIRELVRNRILDREEAERLKPYLDFE
ncbi:MAG: ComEA family DNA-binding protein, partial [Bacteroidota bacterium]